MVIERVLLVPLLNSSPIATFIQEISIRYISQWNKMIQVLLEHPHRPKYVSLLGRHRS